MVEQVVSTEDSSKTCQIYPIQPRLEIPLPSNPAFTRIIGGIQCQISENGTGVCNLQIPLSSGDKDLDRGIKDVEKRSADWISRFICPLGRVVIPMYQREEPQIGGG